MYASDITHRKRNQAIYRDLQRQKAWFAEGGTIRIQYQKGGSDYAYMAELEKGCVENTCILNQPEYQATTGDGLATMNPNEFPAIDFSGVAERGYGYTTVGTNAPYPLPGTLDDGVVPIPMYVPTFTFLEQTMENPIKSIGTPIMPLSLAIRLRIQRWKRLIYRVIVALPFFLEILIDAWMPYMERQLLHQRM